MLTVNDIFSAICANVNMIDITVGEREVMLPTDDKHGANIFVLDSIGDCEVTEINLLPKYHTIYITAKEKSTSDNCKELIGAEA